jgi:RNA polymerase sigma factor (sigma-70 family)
MKQIERDVLNLIQQGGARVHQAIDLIYQHPSYKEAFFRSLQRLGAPKNELEDYFQDAILQTVVNVQSGRFKGNSQLSTYLISIGKHIWLNHLKRQQLQHNYVQKHDPETITSENPEQFMIYSERLEALQEKLSELGQICQRLLSMWSLNYSMREIAGSLGHKSEGYTRKKKHQCLQVLIRIIKNDQSIKKLLQP